MNLKKEKEKLKVSIPFGLVIYVPVEIDEDIDPDSIKINDMGMPVLEDNGDHGERAKKALQKAKESGLLEEYMSLLSGAAHLAVESGEGVRAHISPYAGLAKYTEYKG